MSKFKALQLEYISGNADKIITREKITGIVEIVPSPTGNGALVLRPLAYVKEKQLNINVGSNLAFHMRTILTLSKKEAFKAFAAKAGDILVFPRKGWGETFLQSVQKIKEK